MMYYRICRVLLACLAAVASLLLALALADSVFGMASVLVAPVLAASLILTVTAREQDRLWWFAFACSAAVWLLVLSPALEWGVNGIAVSLQRMTQQGTISLSQRVIEPTALALLCCGPPLGAVLTGIGAGRLTTFTRRSGEGGSRWRFSLRELVVATFALSVFLALGLGRMRVDRAQEQGGRAAFLARFESSFSSSGAQLLAPPDITGGHRTLIPESNYRSFMPPGVNEYRVTAPILRNNQKRWGVWLYTCNGKHDDMIYQFAYTESETEAGLPPLAAKAYVNATWQMIDGVPK